MLLSKYTVKVYFMMLELWFFCIAVVFFVFIFMSSEHVK